MRPWPIDRFATALVLAWVCAPAHAANFVYKSIGSMPVGTSAVALGDLDGDQDLDAYFACESNEGAPCQDVVLRFEPEPPPVYGGYDDSAMPLDAGADVDTDVAVVLADFDRDGDPDAVTAASVNPALPGAPRLRLARNDGGTLVQAGRFGTATGASSLASTDYDGDGDTDLAVGLVDGKLAIYRNDVASPGGAVQFTFVNLLSVASGVPVGPLAFGRLNNDALPDLAVLKRFNDGVLPARAVYYFVGTTPPLPPFFSAGQTTLTVPLDSGDPKDLVVHDLDGNGYDDVVVAGLPVFAPKHIDPIGPGTRLIYTNPPGVRVISLFRFPAVPHTAVAAGRFTGDATVDLLFGETHGTAEASLHLFAQGQTGAFTHVRECSPEFGDITRLATGDVDHDGALDVVALGTEPPGVFGILALNLPTASQSQYCCSGQVSNQLAGFPGEGAGPTPNSLSDISVYRRVRTELMAGSGSGPRLTARYDQFSDEVGDMMLADPTLWIDSAAALNAWSPPVRQLLDGTGDEVTVTTNMIDRVDTFLTRLSAEGSPELAAAIADERARLPSFPSLVGLTMDEFRAIALPPDLLLADGFE